jgi:hypothetical protein
VVRQVTRLVGASRRGDLEVIRARAEVQKLSEESFRVELTTVAHGVEGRRVLEERSCTRMAEATALILAWMVDPDAVDAPAQAADQKTEPASPPVTPSPRTRHSPKLEFGVRGVFDSGTLPALGWGVGVESGVRWSALRVVARGGLWAHQVMDVAASAGSATAGASFGLFALGIDTCVVPWRPEIAGCAGIELDRLEGTGFGVDVPRTDSASWVAFSLGVDGRIVLVGPLGLTIGARLVVPTRRETFGLDGVAVVHRPSVVAGRGAIGLDVVF